MKGDRNPQSSAAGTLVAFAAAIVVAVVILVIGSASPGRALAAFFVEPIRNRYYLGNMLSVASLLALTGLGISVAFRAAVFNLGGEGQTYLSAVVAVVIGLALRDVFPPAAQFAAFGAAVVVGAALAAVSGVLKYLWNTDELITSFLISAGVIPIVDYLIQGPLDDPASNLQSTATIGQPLRFVSILPPSNLSTGALLAVVAVVVLFFFLFHTVRGYELRVFGLNRGFAAYGGISVLTYTIAPMALSGGLHGLAGATLVFGTHHAALVGFTGGLGWNGIAVSLIARNNPAWVIPAALAFSYLEAGARASTVLTDFSFQLGAVIQGVVFLFVTAEVVMRRRNR